MAYCSNLFRTRLMHLLEARPPRPQRLPTELHTPYDDMADRFANRAGLLLMGLHDEDLITLERHYEDYVLAPRDEEHRIIDETEFTLMTLGMFDYEAEWGQNFFFWAPYFSIRI